MEPFPGDWWQESVKSYHESGVANAEGVLREGTTINWTFLHD